MSGVTTELIEGGDVKQNEPVNVESDRYQKALELLHALPDEIKDKHDLDRFLEIFQLKEGDQKAFNSGTGITILDSSKQSGRANQARPRRTTREDDATGQRATKEENLGLRSGPPNKRKMHKDPDISELTLTESVPLETLGHSGHQEATLAYKIKMVLLIATWLFFTIVFLMFDEVHPISRSSSVSSGTVKSYTVAKGERKLSVLVDISGPLYTSIEEIKLTPAAYKSAKKLEVWLEAGGRQSTKWKICLLSVIDFGESITRSEKLSLNLGSSNDFMIKITTDADASVPFSLTYKLNPLSQGEGVAWALVLLAGLYVLIIFEIINRTMSAVLVCTAALAVLSLTGSRPTLEEIVSWLDVETLLLLFSMMILVSIMAETGMFDYLAVYTFEVTKGEIWPLITLLCMITAVLSSVLDNVTTVLLMTPVTIRLCEVMNVYPIPVLMSMVIFSNVGGAATPVGDPPNVIIASNKQVLAAGVNFMNFTIHMLLGVIFVCVQTFYQLKFMFRKPSTFRTEEEEVESPGPSREHASDEVESERRLNDLILLAGELHKQIADWKTKAAAASGQLTHEDHVAKERLEIKMDKVEYRLAKMIKEGVDKSIKIKTFESTLKELKGKYKIRNKNLLIKSLIAITFVVVLFFLHCIPVLSKRVSLGWTALLGAILLLLLADRENLEHVLHHVEWSTLLFFAALFVLMECLAELGLINYIGGMTETLILKVNQGARLAVALLLMLWVAGLASAFVDNIPLTTMMVRIVTALGSNPNLNLPMMPLIWALSFGACLGGNGTLIGASANVVCAGVAEHHGYKFTFVKFIQIGFPIMVGHLLVASIYLMVCHVLFTWH